MWNKESFLKSEVFYKDYKKAEESFITDLNEYWEIWRRQIQEAYLYFFIGERIKNEQRKIGARWWNNIDKHKYKNKKEKGEFVTMTKGRRVWLAYDEEEGTVYVFKSMKSVDNFLEWNDFAERINMLHLKKLLNLSMIREIFITTPNFNCTRITEEEFNEIFAGDCDYKKFLQVIEDEDLDDEEKFFLECDCNE